MRDVISAIEERLPEPTARGLSQAVSEAIRDGLITPGDRLPSIRDVAQQLALSPTTVSSSWRLLAQSGVVRGDGRRGTVVLDRSAGVPSRYRAAMTWQSELPLDLSRGVPDGTLLPSLERVVISPLASAGYVTTSVLPQLHEAALANWPCPAPEVAVVDGAMDALDLIVRTQIGFGDKVAIEHPAYAPLVDLLESVGAQIVPLELDAQGIRPDELTRGLGEHVVALVLQPRGQNPTGVTMTPQRGRELGALLAGSGVLVVEDDFSGAISMHAPISLGQWLDEPVVHIRSYSKSHGPDLRLAVMSGPAEVMAQVQARRHLGQGWTSRLLQGLLATMLADPSTRARVAAARETYAQRRLAVVQALARRGISVRGDDGLNIWVPVRDEATALVRLARDDIGVAPGSTFILTSPYPAHVRVTAGLVPVEEAERVAAAIASAADPRPGRAAFGR